MLILQVNRIWRKNDNKNADPKNVNCEELERMGIQADNEPDSY